MTEGIEIWRGGALSAYETKEERTGATIGSRKGRVEVSFVLASKGGGTTAVSARIAASEFKALAKMMVEVDPAAATAAFAAAVG